MTIPARLRVFAVTAIAAATSLALIGCTGDAAPRTESPAPERSGSSSSDADVHEVDLGDGRVLYMTCAGEGGGPTVLLESGYHESSDTWMVAENDSDRSVFDRLADRYRVCAYDRAGTLLLLDEAQSVTDRTTPVPMPRTAADVVEDLHAGFEGSGESGPFILTAHSLGGFFARLYAQTYPEDVSGLVFVDSFPLEIPELFGDKWPAYKAVLDSTGGGTTIEDYEQIDIEASITQLREAPFPAIPIGVLTKGEPFQGLPDNPVGFTADDLESAWSAGQPYLTALRPDTPQLIANGSDHYIHVRQPDLVEAMVDIVADRTIR